jgi:hypothetical protein
MNLTALPQKVKDALWQDVVSRDLVTRRRACLAVILLQERFLTREQLILRTEALLGRNCFGSRACQDTFFRDMRMVKRALKAEGFDLEYSRSAQKPGYYLRGQPSLSAELEKAIAGSIAEVDAAQIAIFRQMAPAIGFNWAARSATQRARSLRTGFGVKIAAENGNTNHLSGWKKNRHERQIVGLCRVCPSGD